MRTTSISTVHPSASPTTPKASQPASTSDGKFHAELGKARTHASTTQAKPVRPKQASGSKKSSKGSTARQAQAAKTPADAKNVATSEDDQETTDQAIEQDQSTTTAEGKSNDLGKDPTGKNTKTIQAPPVQTAVQPDNPDQSDSTDDGQPDGSQQDAQNQLQQQTADDQSTSTDSGTSKKDSSQTSNAPAAPSTNNPASTLAGWMGMASNSTTGMVKSSLRSDAANAADSSSADAAAGVSAFQATDADGLPGVDGGEMDLTATDADPTDNSVAAVVPHAGKTEPQTHAEGNPNEISIAGLMQNSAPAETSTAGGKSASVSHVTSASTSATPETQFAASNHGNIVSGVRGQLLPNGGSMQIRLDPPELGALQVSVKMEHGVLSASFQTSSDEATKLLSHSLGQLKQTLESQGLSVDRLHVQQAPKGETASNNSGNDDSSHQQGQAQERGQQQDQQRREMLRRMWAQVSGGDPLDLVA